MENFEILSKITVVADSKEEAAKKVDDLLRPIYEAQLEYGFLPNTLTVGVSSDWDSFTPAPLEE